MKLIHQDKITITDPFWKEKIELITNTVIPYQWDALHDEVEGAPKSYSIENFRLAAKCIRRRNDNRVCPVFSTDKWQYTEENCPPNSFKGWVFQDSDLYKWIEAASYSLINSHNPAILTKIDTAIDLICAAAEKDGYINTLYSINNIDNRFTNLKDYHELYCFGHLAQAAIAHKTATGDDRLLDITCRFADLICDTFGGGTNQKPGYPGHEIAEMALVSLYKLTGVKRYLSMASFFINARGQKPYYFDTELNRKTDGSDYIYNQAHLPVREQKEAVGHAVRALYLYCGMADIAHETSDKVLINICKTLWNDITKKKCTLPAVSAQPFTVRHSALLMICPVIWHTLKHVHPSGLCFLHAECLR